MSSSPSISSRIAVCSWSLQPETPEDLLAKLAQTGIDRVQLALDPLIENPAVWGKTPEVLSHAKVSVVSGMFGCAGEDYTTLDTIRVTGGIAPDQTWEQNQKHIKAAAALAKALGLTFVTFHAGFLPHDEADPAFAKLLGRLRLVAEIFASHQLNLGMETGQETADSLVHLLEKLKAPNVGVNFDPANMILYDKGNPIEALRRLGPYIRQVHIKDALRTAVAGTWGQEVAAGTGQVDWSTFFATLADLNYKGDFVIEREAGDQRVIDIRAARGMILKTA